jgi:hypothetical protein
VFLGSERLFKPIVASSVPKKRPMDDVEMSADLPQEDQYAIGAFSPYSYYHGWCFPKQMELYNKYVLFEDVDTEDIAAWKNTYMYLLKKVTYYEQGKQLVLKNQDNTAKIRYLLEMFPNAKFILMKRNPYDIYYSMMKFMRIVIPLYCLQTPPPLDIVEDSMMTLFEKMFTAYLNQRELIPEGNLIEIAYEEFISDPLGQVERIYDALCLDGFSESKNTLEQYLRTQEQVKVDKVDVSEDDKDKIDRRWGFYCDAFGY